MRTKIILLLMAAFTAAPTIAQMGNPAGVKPGTPEEKPGNPAPGELNTQDRLFIKLAGMGNFGEADAGKLADAKSTNASVKAFGRQMAYDHSATFAKLNDLARQHNIALPNEPQPDQKAAKQQLEALDRMSFDNAYLQSQLIDHQKTVQLLEWEISYGQDKGVKRLAMDLLPAVMEHLHMVQTLISQTTGAPPQGLAAADAMSTLKR